MKSMIINGEEWVKKSDSEKAFAAKLNGMPYKMVRTYSAGVFAGYIEKFEGDRIVLRNARRIWYWEGAASLSELATHGTAQPNQCKFPCEVDRVELLGTIEVIDITEEAKKSIDSVPIWTAYK